MEALLLTLDAALMVWLLLSVRRCENRPGKPNLGFFSYIEDQPGKMQDREEGSGHPYQGSGPHA